MRSLKPTEYGASNVSRWEAVVLHWSCVTSHKRTLAQVGETVVSRCFVGCLGQARKRCSNRCCCSPRNYASNVRPIDPLAAGVESPSPTLAPGVVFCTATAGLKYLKKKAVCSGRVVIGTTRKMFNLHHIGFLTSKKFGTSKLVALDVKFRFTHDTFSNLT